MEQQNTTERDYLKEIQQLQNLKSNKELIESKINQLEKSENPKSISLDAGKVYIESGCFDDPEALFNVFKTLALADLNKRLANINQEIKNRLKQ